MRIALDTNRYSDLDRNAPGVAAFIRSVDEVHLPFAVIAELHIGFRRGTMQARNEQKLQQFLLLPGVSVLLPDAKTLDVFANLSVQLFNQGTPIPIHDVWIAALTLQHGLTLYARDKHFDHLPQLSRV